MQNEGIQCVGEIECNIEWKDGKKENIKSKNTVLRLGRVALAASLANDYGTSYDYFISRMLFGNGGTTGGTTKHVDANRNGLFGISILSKPVSRVIDPTHSYQVIFSSVVTYEEAVGDTINEMALQMNNGDLYSMVTFGDISKTSSMQLTWTWRLSFI